MDDDESHSDSIANIIQKFESLQNGMIGSDDVPPRPITAPPVLTAASSPNKTCLVQRKDVLITKLCEEVCYLNNTIVELHDTKPETKFIQDTKYGDHVFEDNFFNISGSVSPFELSANFSTASEKHLNGKDIPVEGKSEHFDRVMSPKNNNHNINELNTSPKLSNLSEEATLLNVKLSHDDVTGEYSSGDDFTCHYNDATCHYSDATCKQSDVTCTNSDVTRRHSDAVKINCKHFTSSQSDIENENQRETSLEHISGSDSSSKSLATSQEVLCSAKTVNSNRGGLQRFGGFENLFQANQDAIGDLPGVQECVARCDWSVENSPQGCDGIRTLHSFDEMNEWHLSTSDLAHIDNMSESSSEENGEVVTDSNDQTLTNGYMHDSNGCHDNLYQGKRSRHVTEDKSLRETIEKTQDHCDKMADEFQRMRKYLQSMADHVYQAPLLTDSRLVCSRDLLDNDSESGASNRHSLSESPCASPRHPASESPCASTRYSVSESPCASTRHSVAESPWTASNYLKPNNDADFNVTRLKKGKSSVRLFAKQDNRDNQSDTHPDTRTDSVTLRQIVRDVCSEEAVSDLAVIRTQLQDKNEEIEQLHCENDDLASSISGLDTRIEDLSEQLSKLQSLNRSLQAQNFNLSTTLSHKDITFDKLKKYLNKGPPSRTQSSSPLDSIQEVSNNAAHKYGFLNRSTHTISRRKSIRPWKKRLAVLDDHNLSIFKVEAVESVLPVNSIIDIQIDSQKTFGKHVIIIRTDDNKEHFLQATTEDDMKEWIQKLHDLLPN